jgi:hypothetical protein
VEVATRQAPDAPDICVRDSKNPAGPVLAFTSAAWALFTRDVKAGRQAELEAG